MQYQVMRKVSHNHGYDRAVSGWCASVADALDEVAPEGDSTGFRAYTSNLKGDRREWVIAGLIRDGESGHGWASFTLATREDADTIPGAQERHYQLGLYAERPSTRYLKSVTRHEVHAYGHDVGALVAEVVQRTSLVYALTEAQHGAVVAELNEHGADKRDPLTWFIMREVVSAADGTRIGFIGRSHTGNFYAYACLDRDDEYGYLLSEETTREEAEKEVRHEYDHNGPYDSE